MPPAPTQPDWLPRLRRKFVVFDGPDGSGKSTQFTRLSALATSGGVEVCEVREPGGTYIGEQVRRVLLDPENKEQIDIRCEMLLFMASRAQLLAQRIRPALAADQLVLADRFISSTLAYQGDADGFPGFAGVPVADILRVGQVVLQDTWPDLVVVFDVDEETALSRMSPLLRQPEFAGHARDRLEQRGVEFHRKVRQGYLDQAADDPQRYLVIDATADADAVFDRLLAGLGQKFA